MGSDFFKSKLTPNLCCDDFSLFLSQLRQKRSQFRRLGFVAGLSWCLLWL